MRLPKLRAFPFIVAVVVVFALLGIDGLIADANPFLIAVEFAVTLMYGVMAVLQFREDRSNAQDS